VASLKLTSSKHRAYIDVCLQASLKFANERSQASSLQTLRQASVIGSNISTLCNIEFLSPKLSEPIPLAHIFMKVIGKFEDFLNSANRGGGVHLYWEGCVIIYGGVCTYT
jgi:hypothetical protein